MTSPAYRANYSLIEWLPIQKSEPRRLRPARSHLPCPMLIRDDMEPVQSQVTGKWHTSKAGIRAEYREHNVVEIGNDPARLRPRKRQKIDRQKVKDAVDRAAARYNRGERAFDRNWSSDGFTAGSGDPE